MNLGIDVQVSYSSALQTIQQLYAREILQLVSTMVK